MELPGHFTLQILDFFEHEQWSLSERERFLINTNRQFLERAISSGHTYYGVNTGFGALCNVRIADEALSALQENLVCSHACGMGEETPHDIVKLMLLLKIHSLCKGYSGVRLEVVEQLTHLYNRNILPIVYDQGSLGASGDLAPLAHMSLPLIGKGWVHYDGKKMPSSDALQLNNLEPIKLAAKEGLALLNGTQFMSAYLTKSLITAQRLLEWADVIGAMSVDAFLAKDEPFLHPIHSVRPHKGQVKTAAKIRALLEHSPLQQLHKVQVQDPYSFRCMPQVHGATKDVVEFATQVVETEINSVTDNPIVFEAEDAILSGGNFHGQPLALQADFVAIAMAELASISERRTFLMLSGQRGLSPFLAMGAGLNSGFMIAQYTAAAIVSQNKQLCTPASIDSITSSNGQEDHVSMGANAVTKLWKVIKNVQRVLAIELFTAAQALDLRQPQTTAPALEHVKTAFRKVVPFLHGDDVMHDHMVAAEHFLNNAPGTDNYS
jgi:histidine ammonia-lyase